MLPRADSKSPCTQRERLGCAEGSMRSSFGKTQGNRLGLVLGTGMDRDIHPATTVTITDWSSLDASSSETGLICERDWRAQVWAWFLWPCALLSEDGLPLEMNGLERARCADENGRRRPRETGHGGTVAHASFNGLRVLSLESRRAKEVEKLILTYGGAPSVVPAMREIGLESNQHVLEFAAKVLEGRYDLIVFMTGVGVRAMLEIVQTRYDREEFLAALRKVKIAARGVKPGSVLRELKIAVDVIAEEPSTWHELLQAIDGAFGNSLGEMHVVVQEYGASNPELLAELSSRSRELTKLPVYQWALPQDLQPLRDCVLGILNRMVDVVLFMTAVQVIHLFRVAEQMGVQEDLREALRKTVVLSIGPTTSEELAHYGIEPDFVPSRPKMGFLVNEAAQHSDRLLEKKRKSEMGAVVSQPLERRG